MDYQRIIAILEILLICPLYVNCKEVEFGENEKLNKSEEMVSCNNNCNNNGECRGEDSEKFCDCKPGTSGDLCETVDACVKDFCGTKADVKCKIDESKGAVCECNDLNKLFDKITETCRVSCNNNCNNNGECKGEDSEKFCDCKLGTSGDLCETVDACVKDFCGTKAVVKCKFDESKGAVCECNDSNKLFDKTTKTCRDIGLDICKEKCGDSYGIICVGDLEKNETITCGCSDKTEYYNSERKLCLNRCQAKCGYGDGIRCSGDQETFDTTICGCKDETKIYEADAENCLKYRCEEKCGVSDNVICIGDKKTDATTVCGCDEDTMLYVESRKRCEERCSIKCGVSDDVICFGNTTTDATTVCGCNQKSMVFVERIKRCEDRCSLKCGNNPNVICSGNLETDADTICECKNTSMVYFKATRSCGDPCTPNPCQNGGTCSVERSFFKCVCKENFSGVTCENGNGTHVKLESKWMLAAVLAVVVLLSLILICNTCIGFRISQSLKSRSRKSMA